MKHLRDDVNMNPQFRRTLMPSHRESCPFCKTSNYAVEYRGVKTKEEKGIEQIEKQRVIEAKIRMRQQELQEEEVRNLKVREAGSASNVSEPSESDICLTASPSLSSAGVDEETMNFQDSCPVPEIRQPLRPRYNREDDFDVGLEDIMVMEAIWLSIQNGKHQLPGSSSIISSENYATEDCCKRDGTTPIVDSTASPSGGFACAIAALVERQQMGGEASSRNRSTLSTFLVPGYNISSSTREQELQNTHIAGSSVENLRDLNLVIPGGDADMDWVDDTSKMANARSRSSSADEYENKTGSGYCMYNGAHHGMELCPGQTNLVKAKCHHCGRRV